VLAELELSIGLDLWRKDQNGEDTHFEFRFICGPC